MNENLQHSEPAISANEGWREMESLLNLHLPAKEKNYHSKRIVSVLSYGVLCMLFILSSLNLNKEYLPFASFEIAEQQPYHATNKRLPNVEVNNRGVKTLIALKPLSKPVRLDIGTEDIRQNIDLANTGNFQLVNSYDLIVKENTVDQIEKLQIVPSLIIDTIAPLQTGKVSKKNTHHAWSISAGFGVNASLIGKQQNFQPYPTAEVKFHLTPRLYVATGISLFSPVATEVSGISKTVQINDSINDIRYYNEITHNNHLKYADVPLALGINISKKISIQAGLQVSFLMKNKTNTTVELFDYQMNNTSRSFPVNGLAAAANPQQVYSVVVPHVDYRFTSSIRYKINRTEIGLGWQYGLRKPIIQNPVSSHRSQLFTLHALFRIKGSKR